MAATEDERRGGGRRRDRPRERDEVVVGGGSRRGRGNDGAATDDDDGAARAAVAQAADRDDFLVGPAARMSAVGGYADWRRHHQSCSCNAIGDGAEWRRHHQSVCDMRWAVARSGSATRSLAPVYAPVTLLMSRQVGLLLRDVGMTLPYIPYMPYMAWLTGGGAAAAERSWNGVTLRILRALHDDPVDRWVQLLLSTVLALSPAPPPPRAGDALDLDLLDGAVAVAPGDAGGGRPAYDDDDEERGDHGGGAANAATAAPRLAGAVGWGGLLFGARDSDFDDALFGAAAALAALLLLLLLARWRSPRWRSVLWWLGSRASS